MRSSNRGLYWQLTPVCRRLAALGLIAVSSSVAGAQTVLSVAGRSNENVSIAAYGPFVTVVWSASSANATDIFAAVSRDGGAKFGAPARVNDKPGDARAGGEQPPRVALVPGKSGAPDVVVVWTTKGANGTKLLSARSKDGGKTFGASSVVPGGEAAGNRGWESITVDDSGRVLALWLDHRNTVSTTPAAMHQHQAAPGAPAAAPATAATPKADPVEKAGLSRLWFGSLDGSVKAASITGGVCYCCKTSLIASGTNVYATWRHVFAGNQRDIGFTVSRDNGKTFGPVVRVSEDQWQFDGCPENGPAIALDASGRAHVAWVTPLDGKEGAPLALYAAHSADGKSFTPRVRVATDGAAGHVQLAALKDGSLVLVWDQVTKNGRRVRLARGTVNQAGIATFKAMAPPSDAEGVYPVVAAAAEGGVVAWVKRSAGGTSISVTRIR